MNLGLTQDHLWLAYCLSSVWYHAVLIKTVLVMTETQLKVVSEKKSNLLTQPNKIWSNRCRVYTGTAGSRRFFLNLASLVAPPAFLPKTSFPGLWVYCLSRQKLQVLTKRKGALPLSSSLKQKFRKNWTSLGAAHNSGPLPHSPLPGMGHHVWHHTSRTAAVAIGASAHSLPGRMRKGALSK